MKILQMVHSCCGLAEADAAIVGWNEVVTQDVEAL